MSQPELSSAQLDHLNAIAKDAASECSKMFSKWVKSEVTITMEELQLVPFQEVMADAASQAEVSICLYMAFDGGIQGSVLFSFPEESAQMLLDMLLRRKPGNSSSKGGGIGELETSALQETANILGCAYLNSLSKNMNIKVIPGPPLLMQDLTVAILESILAQQAAVQEQALLVRVAFLQADRKMDCSFYFLPLLDKLGRKL